MIEVFDRLLKSAFSHVSCVSVHRSVRELAYGLINCEKKSTITGLIIGVSKQFCDWSAYYRLFSRTRISMETVFKYIFIKAVDLSGQDEYVVINMDDTVLKKTGKKIPGTAWRRDALGPPFHTNFIWGQRFIKLSVSVPEQQGIGPARSIPIQFLHCPSATKPMYNASEKEVQEYKEQLKQKNLNQYGIEAIKHVRTIMDESGMKDKKLVLGVDGSYTNGKILKNLPDNASLVGRVRKDAKFNLPAEQQPATGRKKIYGKELPTPEQIRQSDEYPWQSIESWAAGKIHTFNIKVVDNVMWRKAGKDLRMRLIIIRPLGYRLTKKSRLLYRKPAYLICTDAEITIQDYLQFYLWRWQIEVNIGECKNMGIGQAQVRNNQSVESVPAFITAIYSLLLLAYLQVKEQANGELMPRPKWYPYKKDKRITTGDLLKCARAQIYCKGIGMSFSHFLDLNRESQSRRNSNTSTVYAAFHARAS